MRKLGVLALLAVVGACAPKTIPPAPAIFSAPKFPDFVPPVVPPGLADTVAADPDARGPWSAEGGATAEVPVSVAEVPSCGS